MTNRRNVKSGPEMAAAEHERVRDYLSQVQIDQLLAAAKGGRHGVRDYAWFLMMYRHVLRVSEAIGLRRVDVDLEQSRIWIARLKAGPSVEQPTAGDELRAIRRWLAKRRDGLPWLFISERRKPMTRQAANYIVASAGRRAGLGHLHPHKLRHSCGFALSNRGYDLRLIQDYLGHRAPRHTAHYTTLQQSSIPRELG